MSETGFNKLVRQIVLLGIFQDINLQKRLTFDLKITLEMIVQIPREFNSVLVPKVRGSQLRSSFR